MKPERTPWRAMLKLAASFGVAPAQFWRLSLEEWRALVSAADASTLSRTAFNTLAERFPDHAR
jgi:hypothetical protein